MNCLLVINTLSGNAAKADESALLKKLAPTDCVTVKRLTDPQDDYSVEGVEKLIVCGGDGTLNRALNKCEGRAIELYYLPSGTFNETAKELRRKGVHSLGEVGKIGGRSFAYVAAAGSFTELGQSSSAGAKKRFKLFAYFFKVLSAYRAHRIAATLECDSFRVKGIYTLVMISHATRCFGFRFNRLHEKVGGLQILLIPAPERDDLRGRIKIFFPLFRAFFLGFSKEHIGKGLIFASLSSARLTLGEETPFCLDGEISCLSGELPICAETPLAHVRLIEGV